MPTYKFRDKDTGVEFEQFMSISGREKYLKENPNLEQMINGVPMLVDPVRVGVRRSDAGFKEVLHKIHEKTPGSDLKKMNAI
jgi:uncharacterized protein YneF (UPF0154 family)